MTPMRRGIVIGWMLGIVTFGAGLLIGANWYEHRVMPGTVTAEEWRAMVRAGCEPVNSPSTVLYYRCPRLHVP